jgi:hypothetical protein
MAGSMTGFMASPIAEKLIAEKTHSWKTHSWKSP